MVPRESPAELQAKAAALPEQRQEVEQLVVLIVQTAVEAEPLVQVATVELREQAAIQGCRWVLS